MTLEYNKEYIYKRNFNFRDISIADVLYFFPRKYRNPLSVYTLSEFPRLNNIPDFVDCKFVILKAPEVPKENLPDKNGWYDGKDFEFKQYKYYLLKIAVNNEYYHPSSVSRYKLESLMYKDTLDNGIINFYGMSFYRENILKVKPIELPEGE